MQQTLKITGPFELKKANVDSEGRLFIGRKHAGKKVMVIIGGETDE